jgi:hypothetical protein
LKEGKENVWYAENTEEEENMFTGTVNEKQGSD